MKLGLDIAESMRISLSAIMANKGRGALTTLGIVIGIVAVITTMTAANGLENTFRQTFSSVGADVVYVSSRPWVIRSAEEFARYVRRPHIRLEESTELARRLRGRAIVNPTVSLNRPVQYRDRTIDSAPIIGTTDKQVIVSNVAPAAGRFIAPFEVNYSRAVAVIGYEIRDRLFGSADPIGETIRIGGQNFRVIGVMAKQGSSFFGGPNFDLQVFVPVSTFMKALGGRAARLDVNIAVKAMNPDLLSDLEYEVIGQFRGVRNIRPGQDENFSINKLDTLVDAYNSIMGVVVLVGLMITGIALFVGGVGVMNIMFVSVTERTREIGIRKALGARRRSILMQFMFEAAVICVLGGLAGVGIAWLVTLLVNATLMPASLSLSIALLAIAIAVAVGVLAGIAPAWKGARQDPIEALRYE